MLRVSFESHKELVTPKKIFLFFILPILLNIFLSQTLRLNKMNEELSERLFRAIGEGSRTIAKVSDSVAGHKHTSASFCQWANPLSLRFLVANSVLHSRLHLRSDNSNSHTSLTQMSCVPRSFHFLLSMLHLYLQASALRWQYFWSWAYMEEAEVRDLSICARASMLVRAV